MNYSQFSTLSDDILIAEILAQLPLKTLKQLCQSDAKLRKLCQSETLWENRIKREFPKEYVYHNPNNLTWQQLYQQLNNYKIVPVYANGDIISHLRIYFDKFEYTFSRSRQFQKYGKYGMIDVVLLDQNSNPIIILSPPSMLINNKMLDYREIPNLFNLKSVTKALITFKFDHPVSFYLTARASKFPVFAITDANGSTYLIDRIKYPQPRYRGKTCLELSPQELQELYDNLHIVDDTQDLCGSIIKYLKSINHYHRIDSY